MCQYCDERGVTADGAPGSKDIMCQWDRRKKCHCNGNGGVTAESDVKGRTGLCNLIQVVSAVGARDTFVTGRGCKGGLRFSWIVDWAGIPDYRAYRWLRIAYQ